ERETDMFDSYSIHVGVLNLQGEVIATARLIEPSVAGLPIFHHCKLFADLPSLNDSRLRVVEVSRLAVSRKYNRRADDGFYGLEGGTDQTDGRRRREGGEVALNLYKALYQASKR